MGNGDQPATVPAVLGQACERYEDAALLLGQGRFSDDLAVPPGTLHAAVLRSPHAHARVLGVDISAALQIEGVRAILTGEDVQRWSSPLAVGVRQPMQHWVLAVDKVRYVGEPVAVVIAEDRYRAEDGLDKITVEYEPLPVAVDPMAAVATDAPLLHEAVGSNVVVDRDYRYGEPEAAFAAAPHRISLKVRYPRNSCTPIECYVVRAEYHAGDGGYEAHANFQGPFGLHSVMARALQVAGNKLRLHTPVDSGGSFGTKQAVFPYVILMALAARKAGAAVKWVEDRLEHLAAATSATNRVTTIEAAVEADGRVRALSYDQIDDCGAYLRAPEPATTYRMHGTLTGAYDVPNLLVRNRIVLTNKTPAGLVRGFGGPQVYFPLERLMQRIACELGLDPLEVIRKNLVPAGAFPYRAAAGSLLDSGNFQEGIERALAEGGMDELKARREAARAEGRLYGIGLTAAVEPSISNMGYITALMTPAERRKAGPKNGAVSTATLNVDPLGSVNLMIASTPQGQGHRTAAAQVVAEVLGLDPASITVNVDLDTNKDAWSIASGNYSSRFSGAVAGAVHLAAVKLRERMSGIAADLLDVSPARIRYADGKVYAEGSDAKSIPFHRVAGATHWSPNSLGASEPGGLRETAFWSPQELAEPDEQDRVNSSLCYGFIFDYCGVEVDRVSGRVRIDRYVTLHDPGRILNPATLGGQIRGGFAQGVGAALYEEFAYGSDGSFLSGTFADYLVPTAPEVPEPVILHMETPSPFTPLGAKGIGEGNNMSTPVCIANAVADALGCKDVSLPLTPSKVRSLIGIIEPAAPRSAQAPKLSVPAGASTLSASGSIELAAPPEAVFKTLLDPRALQKVIPGCHSFEAVGEHRYQADVTVGVGPIKARYDAHIELSELDPPNSLVLSGKGVGSLGSAEGSGRVSLERTTTGGTRLSYDYRAAVSGKVAAVGGRMLQGAARVLIAQLFERLGRQVGAPAGASTAAGEKPGLWQRLLRLLGARS